MAKPGEIRPKLIEQVTTITESGNPANVALGALYRLYFDSKRRATVAEKGYLLGEGFGFGPQNNIPFDEDSRTFKEEADRYYQSLKKPKPPQKPKK